jgi:hypothetical protein
MLSLLTAIFAFAFLIYLSFETFRIHVLGKNNGFLLTSFISLISMSFGLYLLVRYGLIIDYGSATEIATNHAHLMVTLGNLDILSGLLFVGFSVLRWVWDGNKVN